MCISATLSCHVIRISDITTKTSHKLTLYQDAHHPGMYVPIGLGRKYRHVTCDTCSPPPTYPMAWTHKSLVLLPLFRLLTCYPPTLPKHCNSFEEQLVTYRHISSSIELQLLFSICCINVGRGPTVDPFNSCPVSPGNKFCYDGMIVCNIDIIISKLKIQEILLPPLQWCHNGGNSISNHQPHDCLLNGLFRRRSKKTWKLRVTGLCAGNSPHKWPVTRKMFPFDVVIMISYPFWFLHCFEILHRAWQYHCCHALCKISEQLGNWEISYVT